MKTDPPSRDEPRTHNEQSIESPLEALNARIARLAMALGVSLSSEGEMTQAMTRPPGLAVPQERRCNPERREAARTQAGPDRRMAHLRDELRGLLVLRYSIEKRYVDQSGITATRAIMGEAEDHLVRRGFKPGADGIDLDRLFDKS